MKEALAIDSTIAKLGDLPPGWGAWREKGDAEWQPYKIENF
jgi:hypothetical protein